MGADPYIPLSTMKRISKIGFPLRGSWRGTRLMRCSHHRWRYFFVSFISKTRMLRILHLIRHLTVTPSPQGEGYQICLFRFSLCSNLWLEASITVAFSSGRRWQPEGAKRVKRLTDEVSCIKFNQHNGGAHDPSVCHPERSEAESNP